MHVSDGKIFCEVSIPFFSHIFQDDKDCVFESIRSNVPECSRLVLKPSSCGRVYLNHNVIYTFIYLLQGCERENGYKINKINKSRNSLFEQASIELLEQLQFDKKR